MFGLAGLLGLVMVGLSVDMSDDSTASSDGNDAEGAEDGDLINAQEAVELADSTGAGSIHAFIFGEGEENITNGTEDDDTIGGTAAADNIDGSDGDDVVYGAANDDSLSGGAGSDLLDGAGDHDTIDGGSGNDRLQGDFGDDDLNGGADNDEVMGQSGTDTVQGGTGNDSLVGGAGADLLSGGDGDDGLMGCVGDDTLIGGGGADTLNGNDDDDAIFGVTPNDWGTPPEDDAIRDYLNGGDGDDALFPGAGDNANGGAGDDSFTLGDWIADGGAALIEDYDANEDSLVVVYDDAAHPDPELTVETSAGTPENAKLLLDGLPLAEVIGAAGLAPSQVTLVAQSAIEAAAA